MPGRTPADPNDPYPEPLFAHDDDLAPYEPDPLEELEQECGLRHDGQCGLAGTEHCDFVCPWRNSEDFAGSSAWIAKHKRG